MSTIQQERPTPEGLIEVTPFEGTITVSRNGTVIAQSSRALVLHEKKHVDRYYLPREDVKLDLLEAVEQSSYCPWKGTASDYWSLADDPEPGPVAWSYPEPYESVGGIEGRIAFYDEKLTVTASNPELVSLLPSPERVEVRVGDALLAASSHVIELHEADVPTRYYFPREDVRLHLLRSIEGTTFCPFKGVASEYWALADDAEAKPVAWSYPEPFPAFGAIAGHIAFYDWAAIAPVA